MTFRLLISLAKKVSRREVNRSIASMVSDLTPNSKVLNVGAGGPIIQIIEKCGASLSLEVVSTDIDPEREPDIVDDIVNTKLAHNSFDAIVCAEVLEHVTDPIRASKNLFAVLKPGGRCFVSTPFLFPTHAAPYDFFRYTEFGLRELLSEFEIVELKAKTYWWETFILLAWRQMWIGDFKTKSIVWLLSLFIIPLMPLFYVLSRKKSQDAFTSGFVVELKKPV